MQKNSLVIFKNKPARVIAELEKKIEIMLDDEKCIKLPEKNVLLLHQGSFDDFSVLDQSLHQGELSEAWELLEGQDTSYSELSELIYGEYTPITAYATWQEVTKGIHFSAEGGKIHVNSKEVVEKIIKTIEEKAAKEAAIEAFISRLETNQYLEEDLPFIKEIVQLAQGKVASCRFVKLLQKEETAQNAHKILLDIGFWNFYSNPYPERFDAPSFAPEIKVGSLQDERRVDLKAFEAFAIDDKGSNDPDDAISFDETTRKMWVHIADPASLVHSQSALDIEARSRGSNVYLPEGVVPMLPHEITERLALGLHESSPALSVGFLIDDTGTLQDIEICLSEVKVSRLSYEEAEKKLDQAPFSSFVEYSNIFTEHRQRKGAVELHFPEVKLSLKETNGQKSVELTALETLKSRSMVRDAMLMAGVAVAHYAELNNIPLPFSTQPEGDLSQEEKTPKHLSEMFAVRRRLKKGVYKSAPDVHSGMGLDAYVQATSPLRRYLDLVVHQQLRAFLKKEPLLSGEEVLQRIAESEAGIKSARQAESFSNNHYKCVYLLENPNWQGEAVIIEKLNNNRVTVFIPELSLIKKLTLSQSVELDEKIMIAVSQVKLSTQDVYFKVMQSTAE
ncbi:ribonuclease catalytic domain-containing protein [Fangia hongkongensis]|uniref:ribonuclease catalytic domain-containing protein n=1 Tax=Fangia hongkongensis TaxID=270495 RepID=UPI00036B590C|nr:RNB domain-containing ribonuclease [Fangia hongkongensis]MBK2126180.1 RNB domain-containing ribonuclease [Fangia hongkongensis]